MLPIMTSDELKKALVSAYGETGIVSTEAQRAIDEKDRQIAALYTDALLRHLNGGCHTCNHDGARCSLLASVPDSAKRFIDVKGRDMRDLLAQAVKLKGFEAAVVADFCTARGIK